MAKKTKKVSKQQKIAQEINKEFRKKTSPGNNSAIYNYSHPTDIYLMALRASDQPEVAMTKEEYDLEQVKQFNLGASEIEQKYGNMEQAFNEKYNTLREENEYNLNAERKIARKEGHNQGYLTAAKELAFIGLAGDGIESTHYDLYSLNKMKKTVAKNQKKLFNKDSQPAGVYDDNPGAFFDGLMRSHRTYAEELLKTDEERKVDAQIASIKTGQKLSAENEKRLREQAPIYDFNKLTGVELDEARKFPLRSFQHMSNEDKNANFAKGEKSRKVSNATVTMPRTISGLLAKNKIPVDHPELKGYFFK
jgi:hypothetical protein